jgi:hypothetical protein
VLLTDGEVTNTDEVIALVRRHAGAARVFTHVARSRARAQRPFIACITSMISMSGPRYCS